MHDNVVLYIRPRKPKHKKVSPSLWLLVLSLMTLAMVAIYLNSPWALVAKVEVVGNNVLDSAEILSQSALAPGQHFWRLDLLRAQEALAGNPWLAEVEIQRHFPNKLVITVVERQPVAVLAGTSHPRLLLADDKVILPEPSTFSLPYISGAGAESFAPGDKLEGQGAETAIAILTGFATLAGEISEVNIAMIPAHVAMYTIDGYTILLPPEDDYFALADDLAILLNQLRGEGAWGVVDLRLGPGRAVFTPYQN